MKKIAVLIVAVGLCLAAAAAAAKEENLKEECSNDLQKVVNCFDFATGKAAAPGKECCDSVEVMKENNPKCLCFFIQQTHNGNQQIKDLGIQEIKILQLPSVCHLKNSSVTYCPSNPSFSFSFYFYFSFFKFIYPLNYFKSNYFFDRASRLACKFTGRCYF